MIFPDKIGREKLIKSHSSAEALCSQNIRACKVTRSFQHETKAETGVEYH